MKPKTIKYNGELKELDLFTIQYIRHLFAGRLLNLSLAANNLNDSKYKDIILRDSAYIRNELINLNQ